VEPSAIHRTIKEKVLNARDDASWIDCVAVVDDPASHSGLRITGDVVGFDRIDSIGMFGLTRPVIMTLSPPLRRALDR
jgi:hypothetical protein